MSGRFDGLPARYAMSSFSDFLGAVFRTALRLALLVASGIFVLSFLAAALVVVLAVSLWTLISGRKPAPVMMFEQFRARSRQFGQRGWPSGAAGGSAASPRGGVVVDVEAVEVSGGSTSASGRLRD